MPFGMISGGLVEIVETGCFLDTGLASPAPWNELSYSTGVFFVVSFKSFSVFPARHRLHLQARRAGPCSLWLKVLSAIVCG